MKGEICISGLGLGIGYLNKVEETAKRFVKNPNYIDYNKEGYERIYKTGDFGYYNEKGEIVFYGREDFQVKVNGIRIELEEIEQYLNKHKEIQESLVVINKDDENNSIIYAFIVTQSKINEKEIIKFLSSYIPKYMIPAYFIKVDKIPLTPNGKVDRKALAKIPYDQSEKSNHFGPSNKTEEILLDIWCSALKIKGNQVDYDSDFFSSGGNSIKAMSLVNEVRVKLGFNMSVLDFFKNSNFQEFLKFLENKIGTNPEEQLPCIEQKEYYTVSSFQKRILLLHSISPKDRSYNIPAILRIKGKIALPQIEDAVNTLVERHEILRSTFQFLYGEPVQVVHSKLNISIKELKNIDVTMNETKGLNVLVNGFIQTFDLSTLPLFRVGYMYKNIDELLLVFDFHHIITDDYSNKILISEFIELLRSRSLPKQKLSYVDYVNWLGTLEMQKRLLEEGKFWKSYFKDISEPFYIPYDFELQNKQESKGNIIQFELGSHVVESIDELLKIWGTTLYNFLLTVYYTFLYKLTENNQLLIASVVNGRNKLDFESIVGPFINTILLKADVSQDKSLKTFLEEVSMDIQKAIENQEYPMELIFKNILADKKKFPDQQTINVGFALLEWEESSYQFSDSEDCLQEIEVYQYDNPYVQFDVVLTFIKTKHNIYGKFAYRADLYKTDTINRFVDTYQDVLSQVLANPSISIHDIKLKEHIQKTQELPQFEFNF